LSQISLKYGKIFLVAKTKKMNFRMGIKDFNLDLFAKYLKKNVFVVEFL